MSGPNGPIIGFFEHVYIYLSIFEISWLRRRMTQEGGINRRPLQPEATSPVGEQVPVCTSVVYCTAL